MLEKCRIGRLVTTQNRKELASIKPRILPNRLQFDFRQSNSSTLTLCIYTKYTTIMIENIFVNIENSKNILVLVLICGFVHTIAIGEYKKNINHYDLKKNLFSYLELFDLVTNDFSGKKKRSNFCRRFST